MESQARVDAIRALLAEQGVGALAVEWPANVAYLTGFERVFDDDEPSTVCVVAANAATVFVDSRYDEAARAAAEGTAWRVAGPFSDIWEGVASALVEDGVSALGLEASLPHSRFVSVSGKFAGEVRSADGLVERVRVVKEPAEIERIGAAGALGDAAFEHILGVIAPGVTEAEIALDLELYLRTHGSDGLAFPSIIAGGPNSSRPHAKVSDRPLERGDFLTLDFGARVDGYVSDMTRTVMVGSANDEQRAIYDLVLAANEAGIAAVAAGRTGVEIDAAARDVIAAAGYGERFGHGLGHGVGIEVHEGPRLSPRGTDPVPLGAVVTVEPGVYVPGLGGVRIEDLVVVGEAGATVLTHAPKHLIEL